MVLGIQPFTSLAISPKEIKLSDGFFALHSSLQLYSQEPRYKNNYFLDKRKYHIFVYTHTNTHTQKKTYYSALEKENHATYT